MIKIEFTEEMPINGTGILCFYNYSPINISGWKNIDLREIIREKEDEWLSELDSWHIDISNRAIRYSEWWPLASGSRIHIWSNQTKFSFKSLFYALAILELKKRYPNQLIRVISAPREVTNYINNSSVSKSKITSILQSINFYTNLIKKLTKLIFIIVLNKKKFPKKKHLIIFSTLLLGARLDNFSDHYYGNIFSNSTNKNSENKSWIYSDLLLNYSGIRKKLISINRDAYFLIDFLDINDLLKSLIRSIRARTCFSKILNNVKSQKIGELEINSFENQFLLNMVINASIFIDLIHYQAWKKILNKLDPKALIYPYEEKTTERAMLLAIKACKTEIVSVGFAHAAYSKGHLYLRNFKNNIMPKPNYIALTGESAKNYFVKLGYPEEKLVVIGSPRYKELNKKNIDKAEKCKNKILFIVGHGFEMLNFATMLSSKSEILKDYELLIRRYPYGWIKEQDIAEKKLREYGVKYIITKGLLSDEINNSGIIFYDSSSAGIESSLYGKITIQINLSEILDTKHFIDNQVIKCNNIEELLIRLEKIRSINYENYKKLANQQREVSINLYSPVNINNIKKVLSFDL
jgi:hypothetical protein